MIMVRNSRGVTLIEVLVAIILLGTALVPIFWIFIFGTRHTAKISDIITATYLASEKMEILKSKRFELIKVVNDSDHDGWNDNDLIPGENQIFEESYVSEDLYVQKKTSGVTSAGKPIIYYPDDYKRFNRVYQVQTLPGGSMKVITVKVNWKDKKGKKVNTSVKLKCLVINEKEE